MIPLASSDFELLFDADYAIQFPELREQFCIDDVIYE